MKGLLNEAKIPIFLLLNKFSDHLFYSNLLTIAPILIYKIDTQSFSFFTFSFSAFISITIDYSDYSIISSRPRRDISLAEDESYHGREEWSPRPW
ncbi:MAG: hypothetical protein RRZ66_07475 [Bacteroidales bacterium]